MASNMSFEVASLRELLSTEEVGANEPCLVSPWLAQWSEAYSNIF
jgi:hypothetical protein